MSMQHGGMFVWQAFVKVAFSDLKLLKHAVSCSQWLDATAAFANIAC